MPVSALNLFTIIFLITENQDTLTGNGILKGHSKISLLDGWIEIHFFIMM